MNAQTHDNRVTEGQDRLRVLAKNITFIREAMALTGEQLAEYVGTSASHISKLERAKTANPSCYIISDLARVFGVSVKQLTSQDVSSICDRKRALRRIKDNFSDDDWALVFSQVDVLTRQQASRGQFRKRAIA